MAADAFFIPEGGPYALSHSVGCLPRSAPGVLEQAYLAPWRREGGDAWNAWLAAIDGFRAALARLLGGQSADYCPQPNLSSGLSKLMPTIPRSRKCRTFVTTEDAFPSLGFVLDRAAPFGFERRLVARGEDPGDLRTWERALRNDVAAVLVTHVHSNTGVRTPVADIARLCREREIFCVADIAQSAGILDFSVPSLGADVVLGSCVKWLCGGPGAGFLWVDPQRVAELEPTDVGWFSHAEPFAFDIGSFAFAPDARRFWGGTPTVAPCVLAAESLKVLADIGLTRIERHNRALCAEFLAQAPKEYASRIDFDRTGGTLCLALGGRFDAVTASLRSMGARFDSREDTVRLSFHIYNTAEEAARLGDACHAGS